MKKLARKRLLWRWEDDGQRKYISFYFPKTKGIHLMNPVGSLIFFLCNQDNTLNDIVEHLWKKYPLADRSTVAQDVDGYVRDLLGHDLIEEMNP